jgi:hypothetical protein
MQLLYWLYTSQIKAMKTHKGTVVGALEVCLRECEENGARWPVMQIARLMSKLGMNPPACAGQADAFFQGTGAKDLSELWAVKEIWESRVTALEQLLRDAEQAQNRPAEPDRRLGHEYLFQMLAEQNIATLGKIKFNRIVTQCPHCFNTLKNEYPQLGGAYKVQHYTEYLAELGLAEKITPNEHGMKSRLAYHDSCYLGRYNQVYAAPRQLLEQAGVETVELPRRGENSFCCGGGGGQMWLETDPNTRINHRRLADAVQVQAEVVATACPYCLLMFDDAIRSKGLGEQIQIMDIAEVLEQQSNPVGAGL